MKGEFTHFECSICRAIFPIEEMLKCCSCGNQICEKCGSSFGNEREAIVCEDCQEE